MYYTNEYSSPLGRITIASDGKHLTGLWFEGQKYFGGTLKEPCTYMELPVFEKVKNWLDIYFNGKKPDFTPPLKMIGSDFRKEVWEILLKIPYGKTMTYGEVSNIIASKRGIIKMSARAVGGAVGHNPVSIIIPCHRVIGSNGRLTGYAGGIERKIQLLKLEKADFLPG